MSKPSENSAMDQENLRIPSPNRGRANTDAIRNALCDSTNDDEEPSSKRTKFIQLTPAQLSEILTSCSSQLLSNLSPG
jgi:hypothetical protein